MTGDEFRKRIFLSSRGMLGTPGEQVIAEYYMTLFSEGMDGRREEFFSIFQKFYDNGFSAFEEQIKPAPRLRELFNGLRKLGLKIVIATNPFWPEEIQLMRLKWAGLGEMEFDLVTHAYNMHYIKPDLRYYQEITEAIDIPPEGCLMVGNDPINDMAAIITGMKGFLITDGHLSGSSVSRRFHESVLGDKVNDFPEPHFEGTLSDVEKIIRKLVKY
jgi:FMN phosphatase YigB (HAD superfamily)